MAEHLFSAQLAWLIAGAVIAGVVQGIAGFAFGMVAVSIWAWNMDPREATALAVFGGLCGQVLAALTIRRRVMTSELLPYLIGGLAGVPIGAYLLPFIGVAQFKLLLGLVLAIGCPLMLTAPRVAYIGTMGRAGDGFAGVAGGVIGGLSGLSGVAPAIWCSLRGYDKSRQRELLQNFNLAILAATMVALIWRGTVTAAMVPHLGIVAVALLIPSILGAKIYARLSDVAFRRVVLVLLMLSGLALVASSVQLK
jgi:hypothetical protein